MRIGVLGTNFKSASLSEREVFLLACQKKISSFSDVTRKNSCVIVSTCNRVEIYFSSSDLAEAHSEILQALQEYITTPFEHHLYSYFGFECFLHLVHVTSGLDSAIVAETEIQRQVKVCYETASSYHDLSFSIHYLFQKSLQLGKQIRAQFSLSLNAVTIPKLLFDIAKNRCVSFPHTSVLFVGNSEINRQVMGYFSRKGVTNLTLCSRSLSLSQETLPIENVQFLPWEEISSWDAFSMVICGSNLAEYVISKSKGTAQTELVCDLSIPRVVDPAIGEDGSLTLLNMEEINEFIAMKQQRNEEAIFQAKKWIAEKVREYLQNFLAKGNREKLCV